jgi:hypothetical protein
VDDYCGDGADDSYCYIDDGSGDATKYPIIDIYLGDFKKSGMADVNGECIGPIGNGSQLTNASIGTPGSLLLTDYGGAPIGTGKCGDRQAARNDQLGPPAGSPFGTDGVSDGTLTDCWGYDGQSDTSGCADCQPGITCAN